MCFSVSWQSQGIYHDQKPKRPKNLSLFIPNRPIICFSIFGLKSFKGIKVLVVGPCKGALDATIDELKRCPREDFAHTSIHVKTNTCRTEKCGFDGGLIAVAQGCLLGNIKKRKWSPGRIPWLKYSVNNSSGIKEHCIYPLFSRSL